MKEITLKSDAKVIKSINSKHKHEDPTILDISIIDHKQDNEEAKEVIECLS